jgi:hypothetical protein
MVLRFINRDSGAVTVDWVVLTALILGLTILAATSLSNGALGLAGSVSGQIHGPAGD